MPRAPRTAVLAILAAALALWLAAAAAAVPVREVRATYAGGVLDVSARVSSPPLGSGCAVDVRATWGTRGPAGRRDGIRAAALAPPGVPAGMVTKAGDDGAVRADACEEIGSRPMWTEGRARLQFRPGRLAPGAHPVCVWASQRRADGRIDAHRACTVLRVMP